jgi:hypothetical protein
MDITDWIASRMLDEQIELLNRAAHYLVQLALKKEFQLLGLEHCG